MKIKSNEIYLGNCLDIMPYIDDKSIDMILCDLPYGVTRNKWDCIIPLDKLWVQYERVILSQKKHKKIPPHNEGVFLFYIIRLFLAWFTNCWYFIFFNKLPIFIDLFSKFIHFGL